MALTLAESHDIIERAQKKAAELGIRITVAVVDAGAVLIALSRMDGAPPVSPQVAEAKAVGAAMLLRTEPPSPSWPKKGRRSSASSTAWSASPSCRGWAPSWSGAATRCWARSG